MVNNKEDINSFIKLIKYMHENIKSIKEIKKYIKIFMPYYKFRRTKLDEISIWLPLLLKCIEKNKHSKSDLIQKMNLNLFLIHFF